MTVESLEHQVIALLSDADEPIAVESLAQKLGVHGAEIHRAAEALRARGYRIGPGAGRNGHAWMLTGYPDRLGENELSVLLTTRELGREIRHFEETTSSSEIAWGIGDEGGANGLVVVAESQTKGRGRAGRSWVSPAGCNLYFSVLLRPELPPAHVAELTLVAAVAVCEALRETGCERARIKWPNDIEIGGKKAVGILTELKADGPDIDFVVLGIGVDVNMTAEQLPPELRDIATSVAMALGRPYPRARLLARILDRLETWLDRHEDEGFAPIKARWTVLSSTVGARVRVDLPGEKTIEGRAEGLDDSGHLLVRTDAGNIHKVIAGDVHVVAQAQS